MENKQHRELIEAAKKAREYAYTPYSGFDVGAAIRTKSGKIYTGCNIENASFGATNCAERTALFKAISEGEKEFETIAVVSSANDVTYPCGICRQVMAEHMPNATIVYEDKEGQLVESSVREVLPYMFDNDIPNKK